jgi:hypothetical protein
LARQRLSLPVHLLALRSPTAGMTAVMVGTQAKAWKRAWIEMAATWVAAWVLAAWVDQAATAMVMGSKVQVGRRPALALREPSAA